MMVPTSMPTSDEFLWMTGEESSDPLVAFEGLTVRVDEMASTGHLDRVEDDLADVAALGIRYVRYGINWRRAEPEEGVYDWRLWDRALSAFERLNLEPVVDLMHFGVPDWLSGVGDARLPEALLRYTEAFLARYQSPGWFTPVNEPFVTSHMSAKLGLWNEARTGEQAFIVTLGRLLLADGLASAAIRADRPARFVQAEGFGVQPDQRRLARRLLSFDLRYGVEPLDPIRESLRFLDDDLRSRLADVATREGVIAGHDFYPPSAPNGPSDYGRLARAFHRRYGVPFMVSETSNLGRAPEDGPAWLARLFATVCALREGGLPCLGICWYSRGDQHDWHTSLLRPVGEVTPVGLFDIERRPRPAATALRDLVMGRKLLSGPGD